jgi:GTP1/Obg family GTP-binding protein
MRCIMKPTDNDIKKVGHAFVTLGLISFSPTEKKHLTHFIHSRAIAFDLDHTTQIIDNEHAELVIDAMKTLHVFANDFQDHEIIHDFHDELVDLLINVNDTHGAMVV